jgi:cell volume regulation protein A
MTALTLGNSADLPFRSTIVRFHASLAYLAEIIMFLVLGLLVQPQALMEPRLVGAGIFLALALAFVSRPVAVMSILLPFGYSVRESVAVAWLGLRGAVPIILMTIPLLSAHSAEVSGQMSRAFAVVFVCVVVGSIIPGATVRWTMRLLRLRLPPAPRPSAPRWPAASASPPRSGSSAWAWCSAGKPTCATAWPPTKARTPSGTSRWRSSSSTAA